MNKEVKKAADLMSKKEAEKAAAIAKIDKELTATRAELEELKKGITTGETAEDYKKYLTKIRDDEAVIAYFEQKRKEAEGAGLTPAEYMSITREVKAAADKVKEENRKAIFAEIEKLTSMLTAYDNDITELNAILVKAAQLHKVNPMTINAQEIAPGNTEMSFYMQALYKAKSACETLRIKGIKVPIV